MEEVVEVHNFLNRYPFLSAYLVLCTWVTMLVAILGGIKP
jgi:hypothetical protein